MAAGRSFEAYRINCLTEFSMQTADAFRVITSGDFSHLTTQLGQEKEHLIAVKANGRSIAVE